MNFKKIIALAAALCITTGAAVGEFGYIPSIGTAIAADDFSNVLTLKKIGEKMSLSLSGRDDEPTWKSDDETIATIVGKGGLDAEITAVGKGTTSVYAVFPDQMIRFIVTVLGQTEEDEREQIIDIGTITFTNTQSIATPDLGDADPTEAEWSSSDETVATVDADGTIRAVGLGKCSVSAKLGRYLYVLDVISYYDPDDVDANAQLFNTYEFTNKNRVLTIKFETETSNWRSSDESVITVTEDGTMTAVGSGSCRIYFEANGGLFYIAATSTYDPDTIVEEHVMDVKIDNNSPYRTISMSGDSQAKLDWQTTDENVAIVDENGTIVGVSNGKCEVFAVIGSVKYIIGVEVAFVEDAESKLTVINGIGKTAKFTVDTTETGAVYTSSDTSVVTIDYQGNIESVGAGIAVVTAKFPSGKSTFLRIKVVETGLIGDANCDGKVTIADATAILQSIVNSKKYGLSETGELNADVDGEKGVTAVDALVIQQFDAGAINTLPSKPF